MTAIRLVRYENTRLWPGNPRKIIDEASIARLADDIRENGLRQNLLGRAAGGTIEITAGQRRWLAIGRLVAAESWPDAAGLVPVLVGDWDDCESLIQATGENVGREPMSPYDEGRAFLALHGEHKLPVATIALRTGETARYIRQRSRMAAQTVPEVEALYNRRLINLGQADAMAFHERERQVEIAGQIAGGAVWPESRIRAELRLNELFRAEDALFPLDLYTGRVSADLVDTFLHDRHLIEPLQRAWALKRVDELRGRWPWVEFAEASLDGYAHMPGAPEAGVVVLLRDDLRVVVHEGVVRRHGREPVPGAPAPADAVPQGTMRYQPQETIGRMPEPAPAAAQPGDHPAPRAAREAEQPKGPPLPDDDHLEWARRERHQRLRAAIAAGPAPTALLLLQQLGAADLVLPSAEAAGDERIKAQIKNLLIEHGIPPRLADGHWPQPRIRELLALPAKIVDRLLALVAAAGFEPFDRGVDPGDEGAVIELARILEPEPRLLDHTYLERLDETQLLRVARQSKAVGAEESRLLAGTDRQELIDLVLLSESRDPAWVPPELRYMPGRWVEKALAEETET